MAGHSSFARIKKSRARFGNGVMLLDHSATMVCNAQLEVKKEGANYGRLFYTCSKGKDDSCAYSKWRDKKEDEDPFKRFSTVYFSNPPSYGYTVKETGEKFTSRHENRIEAYKEYLFLKTKRTCETCYANYV